MKLFKYLLLLLLITICLPLFLTKSVNAANKYLWQVQSIDTMKYSRDMARAEKGNPNLSILIDEQMKKIASTGATFVAIDTPYDAEFLPILRQWVKGARDNHLSVWFRGNWSGWEGWFSYPKIGATEHLQKTQQFILANPDLFQDGDIFTSCPECENGSIGDPRTTNRVSAYRTFLINEYQADKDAFNKIGKKVTANYFSMNGDVALLVMDKKTTKALDGVVVIDHYVKTPDDLIHDVSYLAKQSGGEIILGEIGAPIPDIQGNMTDQQQALWLNDVLQKLHQQSEVIGLNYWVNMGGSTALWRDNGQAKPAVSVLTAYFMNKNIQTSPTPSPTIKPRSPVHDFLEWIKRTFSGLLRGRH